MCELRFPCGMIQNNIDCISRFPLDLQYCFRLKHVKDFVFHLSHCPLKSVLQFLCAFAVFKYFKMHVFFCFSGIL